MDNHQAFLRHTLRRLGLDEGRSEDAVQQVFVVASRRLDRVRDGKERAYLFGIATRVASDIRRRAAYRRELPCADIVCEDASLLPDAAADRRRAFEILATAVDVMPPTLRDVFVMSELEEMTAREIAAELRVPIGTVASRLRRARQLVREGVARLLNRASAIGCEPSNGGTIAA